MTRQTVLIEEALSALSSCRCTCKPEVVGLLELALEGHVDDGDPTDVSRSDPLLPNICPTCSYRHLGPCAGPDVDRRTPHRCQDCGDVTVPDGACRVCRSCGRSDAC